MSVDLNVQFSQIRSFSNESVVQNTLELIKKSNFSDAEKYHIIKEIIQKDINGIATRFKEFNISSEKYRYKSAKLLAKLSGRVISDQIQKFDLEKGHIAKIASQALINDPTETLSRFKNYGLDEEISVRVITGATTVRGALISQYFKYLGINTEDRVYQVASDSFKKDPRGSAKHVQEFDLKDENKRFALLRIRLDIDADKALALIDSFGIQTPENRLKAALIAASFDGWKFSAEVAKWNIKAETDRYRLFETALKNHPAGALRYITNYQLNPKLLFAAFDLAIKSKVATIGEYVKQSGLDKNSIFQLALKHCVENPDACLKELDTWGFPADDIVYLKELAKRAQR